MSEYFKPDEVEDEEDDSNEIRPSGRSGIVYLIDANLLKSGYDDFRLCLECIEMEMLNRVILASNDLIGIVLYNTEHSPAPRSDFDSDVGLIVPDNTSIFLPINLLSRNIIKYFKSFKESPDFFDFTKNFGHSTKNSFSEALWLCSRMFIQCGYRLQSSNIVLFTNDERPYPDGTAEHQKSIIRAKDLQQSNVIFTVMPMINEFDYGPFFREFLCIVFDIDLQSFVDPDPKEQRDIMLSRSYLKDYKRGVLRYLTFGLGDGLEMGCGVYSCTTSQVDPKSVKILRTTNETIVSKRTYYASQLNEDTLAMEFTKPVLPGELIRYTSYGGKQIQFTTEEHTNLNSFLPPGIKLLGFKPIDKLPENVYLKTVKFLYPSETMIKGSTKLFRALWQKCLERKKFAMAIMVSRRKADPKYVALVPQTRDEGNHDCFKIVQLPMQANIRLLDDYLPDPVTSRPEEVDIFKKIVKKLRFEYKPYTIENPYLMRLYARIEALAFEYEDEQQYNDTTAPDVEQQDLKISKLVDQVTELFGENCIVTKKRPGTGNGETSRSKLPKTIDSLDMSEMIRNGKASTLTVPQLREYLQDLGCTGLTKLKKQELIDLAVEKS